MKSVVLGTAGHVDHGKTALIEALTGVNTDRWQEERERGITIDLGFARYPQRLDDLDISVVDVPGHEDFVKNMLAGASGVDLLLLVVAADEGPMPQTREHLWIARLLGVRRGVVAVTKADLVDAEWLELVSDSARSEVSDVFGECDWPIIAVSALKERGLADLDRAIVATAREAEARRDDDLFRLPVDRSFTVRGIGTVVTGTVWSGRVQTGGEVRILPGDRTARVRGVQVHGGDVEGARAGQRAALALAGVDRWQVARGDVLAADPVWRSHTVLDASLTLIPDAPWSLKHWQRLRFHLGTSETMARLVLHERDRLQPGETHPVQLRLERPVVARAGDRFVIRFYSPVVTIGGGVVIDPWARRRRRSTRDAIAVAAPSAGDGGDAADAGEAASAAIERLVAGEDGAGADEAELSIRSGLSPVDVSKIVKSMEAAGALRQVARRWFTLDAVRDVREALLAAVASHHESDSHAQGVGLEFLRSRLGRPQALVNAVLADLQREGLVRIEGSLAALSEHRPRLDPKQEDTAKEIARRLREAGFSPPTVKELARGLSVGGGEQALLPVLKFLTERGDLVAVTQDLYYDAGVMAQARQRITAYLAGGGGQVGKPSELREVLGVTRKYLIPLLEYLDAAGLTRRTSEGRVLRETP